MRAIRVRRRSAGIRVASGIVLLSFDVDARMPGRDDQPSSEADEEPAAAHHLAFAALNNLSSLLNPLLGSRYHSMTRAASSRAVDLPVPKTYLRLVEIEINGLP